MESIYRNGDIFITIPSFVKISVPNKGIEILFGPYDKNLKSFENIFNVQIRTSGNELLVSGNEDNLIQVKLVIKQLTILMQKGYQLSPGDITQAAQLISQDSNIDLCDYFSNSPLQPSSRRKIIPKSVNQRLYLSAIENHDMVFSVGPAGTGKTYLAMAEAVAFLTSKRVNRIILARPAVEAGEKLGFLPGDLQEKVNPYLRPLYDALYDMLDSERANRLLDRGTIEIAPLAFMRGRTLNDAFIILDEAQNTTAEQMKMFLTRLGFGSKVVITGDITQIDLPSGRVSGLVEAIKVVRSIDDVVLVRFNEKDVVRHPLVQAIVKAYEAFSRNSVNSINNLDD